MNQYSQKVLRLLLLGPIFAPYAFAQQSPWGSAVKKLSTEVSGTIVNGLAIVAIVVGGLYIAFSEGGSHHRTIGNIIIGLGMALGGARFVQWLFT